MTYIESNTQSQLTDDPRFYHALSLFNSESWYEAHDAFEELWHESYGIERTILQGFLQLAVAEVHLQNGNISGATILYGEGLGRLKMADSTFLGLDIDSLVHSIEIRLRLLQSEKDLECSKKPFISEVK